MKNRTGFVRDYSLLHEKITSGYSLLGREVTSEDLMHLVTTPPEIYIAEGQVTTVAGNTVMNSRNEEKVTIINNMMNRILLSMEAPLTYQDRTYITDVLHSLGIRNDMRFMEEVQKVIRETEHTNDLINAYFSGETEYTRQLLAENVREILKEKAVQQSPARPAEEQRDLGSVVLERLQTGAIYQIVTNFNRSIEANHIDSREYSISEQSMMARQIFLGRIRERTVKSMLSMVFREEAELLDQMEPQREVAPLRERIREESRTEERRIREESLTERARQLIQREREAAGDTGTATEAGQETPEMREIRELRTRQVSELRTLEQARESLESVNTFQEAVERITSYYEGTPAGAGSPEGETLIYAREGDSYENIYEGSQAGDTGIYHSTTENRTQVDARTQNTLESTVVDRRVLPAETIREREIRREDTQSHTDSTYERELSGGIRESRDTYTVTGETRELRERQERELRALEHTREVLERMDTERELREGGTVILQEGSAALPERERQDLIYVQEGDLYEEGSSIQNAGDTHIDRRHTENRQEVTNREYPVSERQVWDRRVVSRNVQNQIVNTVSVPIYTGENVYEREAVTESTREERVTEEITSAVLLEMVTKLVHAGIDHIHMEGDRFYDLRNAFFRSSDNSLIRMSYASSDSYARTVVVSHNEEAEISYRTDLTEEEYQQNTNIRQEMGQLRREVRDITQGGRDTVREESRVQEILRQLNIPGESLEEGTIPEQVTEVTQNLEGQDLYISSPETEISYEGDETYRNEENTRIEQNYTDLLKQVQEIEQYNQNNVGRYREMISILERVRRRRRQGGAERTREASLKALSGKEAVEELLRQEEEQEEDIRTEAFREIERLFPENTSQVFHIIEQYLSNTEQREGEPLVVANNLTGLMEDIEQVNNLVREQEQLILTERENVARETQSRIEQIRRQQESTEPKEPREETIRREAEIVFRQNEGITQEEIEETIERFQRSNTQKEVVQNDMVVNEERSRSMTNVVQERGSVITEKDIEDIERLVNRGVHEQMNAISDQVMHKLEKRLRNEKSRRGI